ncbi:MAG TPA: amidohydrolase family protein [Candidatus Dormibacteraeota bacterium]|nr:amidohydrolase family protein [Candidatus Dormibacteraeota bacterium]
MSGDTPIRLIDMHSHWGTKYAYPLRTPEELALQERTWRSKPQYDTEDGMAAYLRKNGVRAILDLGFTKYLPVAEAKAFHDYAMATQRAYPDVILGNWIHVDPRSGPAGVREFRRVLETAGGFVGLAVSASGSLPADDERWEPYYALCTEANAPALILVGITGLGSGMRGGKGIRLDACHPRHLDEVAATHPDLNIIASRPAWPWQSEMIAILIHKANVWYEVHGWSPRHFTPELKHEIARRLRDRVMFGADYPLFRYERLVDDWQKEGYSPEILDNVFFKNAERFLEMLQT